MSSSKSTSNTFPPRSYQKEWTDVLLHDIIRHAQSLPIESLGEVVSEQVQKIQDLQELAKKLGW